MHGRVGTLRLLAILFQSSVILPSPSFSPFFPLISALFSLLSGTFFPLFLPCIYPQLLYWIFTHTFYLKLEFAKDTCFLAAHWTPVFFPYPNTRKESSSGSPLLLSHLLHGCKNSPSFKIYTILLSYSLSLLFSDIYWSDQWHSL